jgi:hypothetical protein
MRQESSRNGLHGAQIIAFIDDFKLLMIATLAVIPLLVVFTQAPNRSGQDHTLAME